MIIINSGISKAFGRPANKIRYHLFQKMVDSVDVLPLSFKQL